MYYKLPTKPIKPDPPWEQYYHNYDEEIEDNDILTSNVETDLYRGSGNISFYIDLNKIKETEAYKNIPEDHTNLSIKCTINLDDNCITDRKILIDYSYITTNSNYEEELKEYQIKKEKYDKDIEFYNKEVIRLTPLIAEQNRIEAFRNAERQELNKRFREKQTIISDMENYKKKIKELEKKLEGII